MDQPEVTVGAEHDGGRLATCGRAVRRCTMKERSRQREGEAVAVRLRHARWRRSQGDASVAGELAQERRWESCPHS